MSNDYIPPGYLLLTEAIESVAEPLSEWVDKDAATSVQFGLPPRPFFILEVATSIEKIRDALVTGQLRGIAILDDGRLINIPCDVWRSDDRSSSVLLTGIVYVDDKELGRIRGRALLMKSDFDRWRNGENAGAGFRSRNDEPSAGTLGAAAYVPDWLAPERALDLVQDLQRGPGPSDVHQLVFQISSAVFDGKVRVRRGDQVVPTGEVRALASTMPSWRRWRGQLPEGIELCTEDLRRVWSDETKSRLNAPARNGVIEKSGPGTLPPGAEAAEGVPAISKKARSRRYPSPKESPYMGALRDLSRSTDIHALSAAALRTKLIDAMAASPKWKAYVGSVPSERQLRKARDKLRAQESKSEPNRN